MINLIIVNPLFMRVKLFENIIFIYTNILIVHAFMLKRISQFLFYMPIEFWNINLKLKKIYIIQYCKIITEIKDMNYIYF